MKKPVEPHVAEVIRDESGRVLGRICDNFVVKTQEEVDGILKQLGRLWAESVQRAYCTLAEGTAPPEELERCREAIALYEKSKLKKGA